MNKDIGARIKKVLLYLYMALLLSACSLPEIAKQSEIMNSLGQITGEVTVTVKNDAPVHVVIFKRNNGFLDLINHSLVDSDGKYILHVIPDTYFIAAYVDTNNDETYQFGEPASYLGIEDLEPIKVHVNAGEKVSAEKITVSGSIKNRVSVNRNWASPLHNKNIGRIVSLNDPIFHRENAEMGLWKPLDFLNSIGGGLFFLQEFDEEKIPVLFIHGINGSALDWEEVIGSMDRERFQPWVLYYPSGGRLDLISNYIIKSMNTLRNRHKIKQLYVIAHSMGGLVARSYIMKHTESESAVKIALSMTINSPMQGMKSAKSGVQYSPIIVPSWRDVANDSKFIQKITEWTYPTDIPYHLIFSYQSGEGSDGVVSLESQIPLKLQAEAERIYGFNSGHASVLQDKKFIARFNNILEEVYNNTVFVK
ncbi:MAG: alpha/beta fold hydrolase [Gammaproteobacteria bacterium]|nr:alpha/beta fold hydrolase [Gammaproteobacteria bacterium]